MAGSPYQGTRLISKNRTAEITFDLHLLMHNEANIEQSAKPLVIMNAKKPTIGLLNTMRFIQRGMPNEKMCFQHME